MTGTKIKKKTIENLENLINEHRHNNESQSRKI